MLVLGTLGLVLVVVACTAFATERRQALTQGRRMRPWFVATDVIGALFGLVVAAVAFAG